MVFGMALYVEWCMVIAQEFAQELVRLFVQEQLQELFLELFQELFQELYMAHPILHLLGQLEKMVFGMAVVLVEELEIDMEHNMVVEKAM